MRVPGPAEILHGGQQSWRNDANVVQKSPFEIGTNFT
jgi:hypothetical protein